jgi:hypothetical protein
MPVPVVATAEVLGVLTQTLNRDSMSAYSGLSVSPVLFQAVEHEGRWKPASLFENGNENPRVFQTKQQKTRSANDLFGLYGSRIVEYRRPLFRLETGAIVKSIVQMDAVYWADGLEIWGGYAGMSQAEGFGNKLSDNASVSLYSISFGNYFPASVMIAWSGWISPIDPNRRFLEFRGWCVVCANGKYGAPQSNGMVQFPIQLPCSMTYWPRGMGKSEAPTDVPWDESVGFSLVSPSLP